MEQFYQNNGGLTPSLADLESRYGGVMGQAIYDQLILTDAERIHTGEPDCVEVLQLSEIAHRLRTHVRDLIQQYRAQEYASAKWSSNVVTLLNGSGTKGEIFRAYRLYKKMNRDFHALYEECMKKVQTHDPVCIRRWHEENAANGNKEVGHG